MNLALFDFDGTITKKDTLLEFIKFYRGSFSLYFGFALHSPLLILMKSGFFPNWRMKELILRYFFAHEDIDSFNAKAQTFSLKVIPNLLRPTALERLRWHREQNDRILIVSSSFENWLKPWCDQNNIELLASSLEVKNKQITGKIAGKNVFGPEKVKCIKQYLNLQDYEEIFVYGDSKGDAEMFDIGSQRYIKPFN